MGGAPAGPRATRQRTGRVASCQLPHRPDVGPIGLTVAVQTIPNSTVGIVLAAGAGRRFGLPKALVIDHGMPWVSRATELLRDSGCAEILVVLGASADAARQLVPSFARVVVAADWERGMSASVRAGLAAAESTDAASALLTLVDLPALPLAAVRRVRSAGVPLAQATWGGAPGHPVLIARSHWGALAESVAGDSGARNYLAAHGVVEVECGDLGDGRDVDDAGDLAEGCDILRR